MRVLLICLCFCFYTCCRAALSPVNSVVGTYYVSTNGSAGGNGSFSAPFSLPSQAVSNAPEGTTILIDAGVTALSAGGNVVYQAIDAAGDYIRVE